MQLRQGQRLAQAARAATITTSNGKDYDVSAPTHHLQVDLVYISLDGLSVLHKFIGLNGFFRLDKWQRPMVRPYRFAEQ
jgi:hypothetical protein